MMPFSPSPLQWTISFMLMAAIAFPRSARVMALMAFDVVWDLWLDCLYLELNCRFFVVQWILYRRLSREIRSLGFEPPLFRFEPLQREQS